MPNPCSVRALDNGSLCFESEEFTREVVVRKIEGVFHVRGQSPDVDKVTGIMKRLGGEVLSIYEDERS